MQPLISVIVPVYNVEKYLPKCLDSIINQTYKNLEIIVVDDGSTDNSGKICDEYANRDSRINVIHKENGGVSSSRNIGIENAIGEYILFIDADDEVKSDYAEKMIESVRVDNYDLVVSNIEDVYEKFTKVRLTQTNNLVGDLRKDYFILKELMRVSVVKLYKTAIIKNYGIRFLENMKVAEDQVFNFQYFSKVNAYKFINYSGYRYFHRKVHSLSKCIDERAFEDEFKKMILEREFYDNNNIENKEYIFMANALGCILKYSTITNRKNNFSIFKRRTIKVKTLLYGFDYYINYKQWFVLKCLEYNLWHLLYWAYRIKLKLRR